MNECRDEQGFVQRSAADQAPSGESGTLAPQCSAEARIFRCRGKCWRPGLDVFD